MRVPEHVGGWATLELWPLKNFGWHQASFQTELMMNDSLHSPQKIRLSKNIPEPLSLLQGEDPSF